jgi:hypothetical protein
MFTGLLKRFLNKIISISVFSCAAIVLLTATNVEAAHNRTLIIDSATWDGNTLTIAGKGERNVQVDASNAASPFQVLGSDTPANNGRWSISNSDGTSATVCRVHVEQDDGVEVGVAELDVTGNPFCEGSQNDPPVCTIDTPVAGNVTIFEGETVDYTGTATDIDGVIQSYSWTFEGGFPASSTAEDPGLVTYNTPGSYTTTFDATDNGGASCLPPGTRTITVQAIGGPPTLPNQTEFKMMMNYELGMHCTGFEFAYCCVLPAYNSILAQVVKPQNGIDTPRLLEADPNMNTSADVLGRHTVVRDYELDGNGEFKKYVLRYWHDAQPRNDGNGKPQTTTLISNVEGNSLLSWGTVADSAKIVGFDDPCTYDVNGKPTGYNRGAVETGPQDGATGVVLGDGNFEDTGCTFGVPVDNYQNAVWNHLYIYEVSAAGVEGHKPPGAGTLEAEKYRLGLHVDYPTNFGPAGHGMEGLLTFSGDSGTVVYTQMKVLEDLPITLTSPRIWEALGLPLTPFEDSIGFFNDPGQVDEDSIRPYVQMKARLHHANCDGAGNCTEGDAVLDNQGNEVIGFGTAPIDIPNCERCHSAFDSPNSPNVTGTPEAALVQQEINFWNAYYNIDTGSGDSDWYSRLKGAAISMLSAHDIEHGTSFAANYPGTGTLRASSTCDGPPVSVGNACVLHADCDTVPGAGDGQCDIPQNTRLGHESVICQKCHADNVIAVVKSTNCGEGSNCSETAADELFSNIAPVDPITGAGHLIPPLTEAIHWNHREVSEGGPIEFSDATGRSGGCQGCHPAHRSDGDMGGYPIDLDGNNFYADLDNRDANGGCFVGRDVHSNPAKDLDGAETPSHLNPVGEWLQANVANDSGNWKGVWCTNCHSQAGQQMWKAENVADLVNAQPGDPGHVREPFAGAGLSDVVAAINASLGTTTTDQQFIDWLDPQDPTHPGSSGRVTDQTSAIWQPDPGMCNHAASLLGLGEASPYQDGNVATIEIALGSEDGTECSTGIGLPGPSCLGEPGGAPSFYICGSVDGDGDVSVSIQDFCTTPDCVAAAQQGLVDGGFTTAAVPVPMSAATNGRDHWLAPGEPHCADCHAAPYVEQSGNINAFAPFNYPKKASLMRYSRGHQDITCQGCHESIHGLYPVTPTIDTTSYAQAASLNHDNTHGPLKCGTCHDVDQSGIPVWVQDMEYLGQPIGNDYDAAVSWMHTYTLEASPLAPGGVCENCHGVKGNNWDVVGTTNKKWIQHGYRGRASRNAMDRVELETQGYISGSADDPIPAENGVCQQCHRDRTNKLACNSTRWKNHLIDGRVAESVWEDVSNSYLGSTCGW